jgi:hypothetical protein
MLPSAPAEMQNSVTPSAAWEAPRWAPMSGTRAAQLPHTAPITVNNVTAAASNVQSDRSARGRSGARPAAKRGATFMAGLPATRAITRPAALMPPCLPQPEWGRPYNVVKGSRPCVPSPVRATIVGSAHPRRDRVDPGDHRRGTTPGCRFQPGVTDRVGSNPSSVRRVWKRTWQRCACPYTALSL